MSARSHKRKQVGFTLVEMVVAAVLLAVGIAATLGAITSSTQATSISEHFEKSALLAQHLITQLSLQPEQIASGEKQGDYGEPYQGYRYTQRVETGEFEHLYRVTIIVEWRDPNHPQRRTFTTYIRYNPDEQKQDEKDSDQDKEQQDTPNGDSGEGDGNDAPND